MLPFMVGTAFLTNVFYLPYLGLRRPLDDAVAALDQPAGEGQEVSANEISLAESKGLPLAMLAVFSGSVLWACFGRGAEFGDVSTRMAALVDMVLHSDRLAHSFMVDSFVFWGFQGSVPTPKQSNVSSCLPLRIYVSSRLVFELIYDPRGSCISYMVGRVALEHSHAISRISMTYCPAPLRSWHPFRVGRTSTLDCRHALQSTRWLVPDDMRRRGWDNSGAEVVARVVPFFGLIYYLLARPPLPDQASDQ
jgi:hypothetical protein